MNFPTWLRIALFGLALLASGGAASAQATRTWVSGVGDDANPCSRTAPCKTFAGAISKTAAQGEIDTLDPGGFGTVTITKAISIVGVASPGSVLASGTTGVTVNAGANDRVVLRNLQLEGTGTGTNGINYLNAGSLEVDTCVIHGFTGAAISILAMDNAQVFIRNSYLSDNGYGLRITGSGARASAGLDSSTLYDNATAIAADGSSASVYLTNNTVFAGSVVATNSASILSYGNNRIVTGTVTQTLPLR